MRTNLELVARRLVDVRRAQYVEALDPGRQRNRALDDGTRALRGIHDLERRLINQLVIVCLQADPNSLILHPYPLEKSLASRPIFRCPSSRKRRAAPSFRSDSKNGEK